MWSVNISFEDGKGATSTTSVNLPDATSLGDAEGMAKTVISDIRLMITGRITGASISRSLDLSTGLSIPAGLLINAPAAATSDVEEGARFNFRVAGGFRTSVRIPTINETLIVAGTRSVDLTNNNVTNFVNHMVNGADQSGNTIEPTDARGADIVALDSAVEDFQRSRRLRY